MPHRDIVIVPAYFRPEFLHLCLENLWNCPEMLDKDVWVYHDQKYDDSKTFAQEFLEVQEVLKYWKNGFRNRMRMVLRPESGYYGNSYNVLAAYAKAYETDAKYVFLVEEDVFVTPDFFRWHKKIQEQEDCFCSIAGQTYRNEPMQHFGLEAFFRNSIYSSIGVCWKRENLSWTETHAVLDYYQSPTQHILKHFPASTLGLSMMEQDGIVQRIMESQFKKAIWACVPRAYHAGVFGYHRGIGKENMFLEPLPDRVEKYRKALSDPEWLAKVAGFQSDVQPFPGELPKWEHQFEVQCQS